jgi:polysaccharide biosynthesis/export protein
MFRWLAPFTAAFLFVLGGCAQDDLGLGNLIPADIIFDAPQQSGAPPGAPIPVALRGGGWGETTVAPAGAMVSPTPVPWGAALVVPAAPYMAPSPHDPYVLDTGDKLRIFVYGQPNLSRIYAVDQVGNVAFPLIGSVRARGRTSTQLGRAITSRLSRDFVRDPFVTVDVAQNRPFFILGEVRLPGQYPYVSGMTVETAVAIAGGYTERASERRFRITRRFNGLVDQIEAPSDYALQPGDTVYVFERFF